MKKKTLPLSEILKTGSSYTWKQLYDAKEVKNKDDPNVKDAIKKLIPLIEDNTKGGVGSCSDRKGEWFEKGRHEGSPDKDKKNNGQKQESNRLEELLCMAFFNAGKLSVGDQDLTIIDYQVPTFNAKENIDLVGYFIDENNTCRLLLIEAKKPGSEESALRAFMEITAHIDKFLMCGLMKEFIDEAKRVHDVKFDNIEIQPAILLFEDNAFTQTPNSRGIVGICSSKQVREIKDALESEANDHKANLVKALHARLRKDAENLEVKIAPFVVLLETAAQKTITVEKDGKIEKASFRHVKGALLTGVAQKPRKPEILWEPHFDLLTFP